MSCDMGMGKEIEYTVTSEALGDSVCVSGDPDSVETVFEVQAHNAYTGESISVLLNKSEMDSLHRAIGTLLQVCG